MFGKLMTITLVGLAIGATTLVLRQQRLTIANETAAMHHQMNQVRQQVWHEQTKAAAFTDPSLLTEKIEATQLAVESPIHEWERAEMRMHYAERGVPQETSRAEYSE